MQRTAVKEFRVKLVFATLSDVARAIMQLSDKFGLEEDEADKTKTKRRRLLMSNVQRESYKLMKTKKTI